MEQRVAAWSKHEGSGRDGRPEGAARGRVVFSSNSLEVKIDRRRSRAASAGGVSFGKKNARAP